MFGLNREEVQQEVKALHKRIGARLFGEMGQDCLNLSSSDWKTRNVGILGNFEGRIIQLEDRLLESYNRINDLRTEIISLKSKKQSKTAKKKKTNKKAKK